MSVDAPLTMQIRSDPCALAEVRTAVRGWARARAWTEDQISEIVLALDEALTNVIRHGYGGEADGRIDIEIADYRARTDEAGIEIRVRDYGRQVDPDRICGRDLDDVRPGGLGVHIIRSMMSSVEYQRAPDAGMLLIMRKLKTHRAPSPRSQE